MDSPLVINENSYQEAWISAARSLKANRWETWNLIAQIDDPSIFNSLIHESVSSFSVAQGLLTPKHVACTIFPYRLYDRVGTANGVFSRYNKRLYPWTKKALPASWGTYFHRMIHYPNHKSEVPINQLKNVIDAINSRTITFRAAYTILIQKPGSETLRVEGGPCLNYLALQLEPGSPRTLSLFAVYRNHEFLERAYGNYMGLCKLQAFLAKETNSDIGRLTCISSHAYVKGKKRALSSLLASLP